jgi:TolB-like protein/thioredoxin-like negative regulator of GroEL
VTDSGKAVFLSYASQDAETAQRLCNALRAAGIEVWFDQSELRGGDAWDQKIRQQIRDCALFVPIISVHTQARPEGYFRLEWKLAVDRSHLMATEKAFLVPVVVDATTEPEALVPTQFRDVQWTRIPAGEVPTAFVDRIAALLNQPVASHMGGPQRGVGRTPARRLPVVLAALSVIALVALVIAMAMHGEWLSQKPVTKVDAGTAAMPVANTQSAVSERSVAVLPFVDMSEKKDQEYFSDGLSEELIGLLSKVPDLKVPGRTSSFYFKGKQTTIVDIARTLGVAHVLEGSVRRSGNTLRITAQLIQADSGYDMWSETYDRKLDDIFKLQDEISAAVVKALKIVLLADAMPKAKPTANQQAYSLFLLSRSFHYRQTYADVQKAIDYAEQAVKLDPTFAPAWAALGDSLVYEFGYGGSYAQIRARAYSAAQTALRLDPKLSDAHVAMGRVFGELDWDWQAADAQLQVAIALDPNNVLALGIASSYALIRGRGDEALRLVQKAAEIDPLSEIALSGLGIVYYANGRYAEAETVYRKAIDVNTAAAGNHLSLGTVLLAEGQPAAALEVMQKETDEASRQYGLALAYEAAGRRPDADQALTALESRYAGSNAEEIASVYACRKEPDKSFAWFDRAYQQRDLSLVFIKTDPCIKSLQAEPRYKVLLKKLNLL